MGAAGRTTSSNEAAAAKAEKPKEEKGVVGRVLGATKRITSGAAAVKDPISDHLILVIVGALTLASAFLGALVLYRVSREYQAR